MGLQEISYQRVKLARFPSKTLVSGIGFQNVVVDLEEVSKNLLLPSKKWVGLVKQF